MEFDIGIWAMIGFIFAAYAVVGNDALQTLGTFINSNRQLHWTTLFAFAAMILVVTFTYGWQANGGDPSYGRLANETKYPVVDVQWYHILPPFVLLIITRLGIPVSTSFMVLTVFATVGGLASMIQKSLIGYALAFVVGGAIYLVASRTLERWFERNDPGSFIPHGLIFVVGIGYLCLQYFVLGFIDNINVLYVGAACIILLEIAASLMARGVSRDLYWVTAQWVTTAYLWGVWLIQDFANIFVFLPRQLTAIEGFGAMAVIVVLLGITFANRGGPVQKILQAKTAVTDIRSATVIDLIYATLLFYFKEVSNIPMSTTWVFLGLIAGREYAFALMTKHISFNATSRSTLSDVSKAFIGLVISVDLAVALPFIAQYAVGGDVGFQDIFETATFGWFVGIANAMLIPVFFFLSRKSLSSMVTVGVCFVAGAIAFSQTSFG